MIQESEGYNVLLQAVGDADNSWTLVGRSNIKCWQVYSVIFCPILDGLLS